MIALLEIDIALSDILLTACTDQLLYNFNLIKLCSTCAKQNALVKTASEACSMLAIQTLSGPFWQCPSSFIVSFEQVMEYFLVWNIYFTL